MLVDGAAAKPAIYSNHSKAMHIGNPRFLDIGKSTFRQTGVLLPLEYLVVGAIADIITI